jgi:hypothetical protein
MLEHYFSQSKFSDVLNEKALYYAQNFEKFNDASDVVGDIEFFRVVTLATDEKYSTATFEIFSELIELQTGGGEVSPHFSTYLQTLTYNIFDIQSFEYFWTHEQGGFHRHTMRFNMDGQIYEKQGLNFEGNGFEFFNECIEKSSKSAKKIYYTIGKNYMCTSDYGGNNRYSFLDEEQVQILMSFGFNKPWIG